MYTAENNEGVTLRRTWRDDMCIPYSLYLNLKCFEVRILPNQGPRTFSEALVVT